MHARTKHLHSHISKKQRKKEFGYELQDTDFGYVTDSKNRLGPEQKRYRHKDGEQCPRKGPVTLHGLLVSNCVT